MICNEYRKKIYFYRPVIHSGDSTVTALEVRRQKEQELRNNDLYWQKRLRQQEESLKQSSAALEKEFNETVTFAFQFNRIE